MSPSKQVLHSSENVAKKGKNDVKHAKIKQSPTFSDHHQHPIVLHSSSNHHNHHHPHPHHYQYYHHQQQYYQQQQQQQHYYPHQQHRSHPSDQRDQKESPPSSKLLTLTKTSTDTSKSILKQPKPPRSAFMCFKDNKKKEVMKKEGIAKDNDDLLKIFATAWKILSDKDRAYWDEEARNDKVRFVQEKAVYKGPWNTPKRRAKKHPGAPKRPMSAFLKFSKGRRKTVKEENPDVCNTDVSRLLGEMWRNASEAEKAPYVEAEIEERNKYKDVMQKWKDEQAQLDAVTRTSHESAAQIFRHNNEFNNDHHQHHQQQQQHQHQQQHQQQTSVSRSKSKSQQYLSAFERPRDKVPTIGAHFENLNIDNLMEDSKRSAFRPHAPHHYYRPQYPTSEYFSSDGHHQPSWPDLSLQQSLDHDSDPLPVVPGMLPPLQMPKGGNNDESTRSIYFSDAMNVPQFSRYP